MHRAEVAELPKLPAKASLVLHRNTVGTDWSAKTRLRLESGTYIKAEKNAYYTQEVVNIKSSRRNLAENVSRTDPLAEPLRGSWNVVKREL